MKFRVKTIFGTIFMGALFALPAAIADDQSDIPDWLLGKWAHVQPDGENGYKPSSGFFDTTCNEHEDGYIRFLKRDGQLYAKVVALGQDGFFGNRKEGVAAFEVASPNHVIISPEGWRSTKLEVTVIQPGILSGQELRRMSENDDPFFLGKCES